MQVEKQDRRVKRTQQLLGNALIALAQEKDYAAITIKDITDRADVAYITFFRHYHDKDELLMKIIETVIEEIERTGRGGGQPFSHEYEGLLTFQHVQSNMALYRVLLTNPGTAAARKRVCDRLTALVYQHCARHPPIFAAGKPIPLALTAHHMASSLLSLIEWWLEQDMPEPPERMAQVYVELIVNACVPGETDHS